MAYPFTNKNSMSELQRQREIRQYKERLCPDYPVRALPDIVFQATENGYHATQAPFQLVVQSVLGFAATIAQRLVDVQLAEGLPPSPVSLFLLAGAVSGDRKTTTDKLISAPLYAYDRQQQASYNARMMEYKANQAVWEVKNKALRKQLKKHLEEGGDTTDCENDLKENEKDKPAEPQREQMLFADTTYRGLTEMLPEYGASVCLLNNEAGSNMKKQMAPEVPKYSALWDGANIVVNRVAGHRFIHSPRATLNWMVQPDYIEKLFLSPDSLARSSGLAARILFCFPASLQGTRFKPPGEQIKPELDGLHKFHEIAGILLQKPLKNGEREVLTIRNQYHFDQLYNDIEAELIEGGTFSDCKDAASKMLENIARMAAVFHVFSDDYASGSLEIPEHLIDAACEICAWHMKQFMSLFDKNAQIVRNAYQLMDWIDAHEHLLRWRGGFSFSALLQFGPPCIRKRALLSEVIDVMQELYPNDYFYSFSPADGSVKYIFTKSQAAPRNG